MTLLQRVGAGDSRAVWECVDAYGGMLWSLARRYSANREEAEDAVRQVFRALWPCSKRFEPGAASEQTFVATLARRQLIDRARASRPESEILATRPVAARGRVATLDAASDVRRAAAVLAELPSQQRRCIELSVLCGVSEGDVARSTGLPLGTVKDHLRRGLQRISPDAPEEAAAAADLALAADPDEPLPEALRRQIAAEADPFFGEAAASRARGRQRQPRRMAEREVAAWLVAAAAIAFAVFVLLPRPQRELALDLAAERARLLATAEDAIVVPWHATEDPAAAGASGDVVWSPASQSGFIRIRGLAPNDASEAQYQLWIFDATRDLRHPGHPVDGGVFDVGADEVVFPIRAKLPVLEPTFFAVSIERPGGVVVSDRERVPLLAKVGSEDSQGARETQ